MKDTLKMQEEHTVIGIKKLIDYYNENYTKKKEYICKDLKPARMLNREERDNFSEDAGVINPQEIYYYPLFKISKIKNNRPRVIVYILKIDNKEYKGVIKRVQENVYNDKFIQIIINGDEVVLETNNASINTEIHSLTLYINSFELPKLEYPKNKMDMYRAMSFIETVSFSLRDDNLDKLLRKAIFRLPNPNNINELNLVLDIPTFDDLLDIRNNAYFINFDKDNYYTILDAIKKGETIYKDLDTPLVNWEINKEEKVIYLGELMATETGLELPLG
jgi:hypothetical protein|nr:MAG TPA: hypothetical protein [Caudoviricetes sp.]